MAEITKKDKDPNILVSQWNETSQEYKRLTGEDPVKKYVQQPEALKLLGDIKGKKVLDVGCGSGIIDEMMAESGAVVTGYDPAEEQIAIAKKEAAEKGLGIRYFTADNPVFLAGEKFDQALSVMVLQLAENPAHLKKIFADIFPLLENGGVFTSLVIDPNLESGKTTFMRRFTRTGDGKIKIEFLNPDKTVKMSAQCSDFTAGDYEVAAKEAGFKNSRWEQLSPNEEGKKAMGEEFWKGFEQNAPWIGFIAEK